MKYVNNPKAMALKMNFILEAFAEADTLEEVCFGAGITDSTLRRWRLNDSDFDNRCVVAAEIGMVDSYEV